MSQAERLDRELTDWFSETAVPSIPDWTDELLALTARTRQRPRWAFRSRWLPGARRDPPGRGRPARSVAGHRACSRWRSWPSPPGPS